LDLLDLHDSKRDRAVPVARYAPSGEPRASILFSVGFGGGREGYAYLGRAWAERGCETVVVEHVGSNLEALKPLRRPGQRSAELAQLVAAAVRDPGEQRHRVEDLAFVRRALPRPSWILAGHSYGAGTVLRAAPTCEARALLALSPPAPEEFPYEPLAMPVLLLTGTRDDFAVSHQDRSRALEFMAPGRSALAVIEGADHMGLAGVGLDLAPILAAVQTVTGAFLEDVLAGRALRSAEGPGVTWRLRA